MSGSVDLVSSQEYDFTVQCNAPASFAYRDLKGQSGCFIIG